MRDPILNITLALRIFDLWSSVSVFMGVQVFIRSVHPIGVSSPSNRLDGILHILLVISPYTKKTGFFWCGGLGMNPTCSLPLSYSGV